MAYPVPTRKRWTVQIEFLDGTTIDATSDADAIERWMRLSAWLDPTVWADPEGWLDRALDRARVLYGARLIGITGRTDPRLVLDALAAERVLILRRR